MINLLPDIKKSITNSTNKGYNDLWNVKNAHPKTGKISECLKSEFTSATQSVRSDEYQVNITRPLKEPNERHIIKYFNSDNHKSPLDAEECGIADEPQIIFSPPKPLTYKTIDYDSAINNSLIIKLVNTLPLCMELFVQKKSTITNSTVYPNLQSIRLITGTADPQASEITCFWTCSIKRGTITCTNRQIIKTFRFDSSMQIGLEVEMVGDVLKCTNVLDACQATKYKVELDGAEVIAVNSSRVISMEEFRHAMITAREHDELTLQVAAFLDDKGKQEVISFQEFSKKKNVKSLLSNIMLNGLDQDHQHGLFDLKEDDDSSSSDDNEPPIQHQKQSDDDDSLSIKTKEQYAMPLGEEEEQQSKNSFEAQGWDHLEQYADVIEDDEHGMKAMPKQSKVIAEVSVIQQKHVQKKADDDEASVDSDFSNNSWAITKRNEVCNITTIACAPKNMSRSMEWGFPKKYLQISNYSSTWQLEIFWIDEDGVLNSKGHIKPRTTQFQMCCEQQLWTIVATSTLKSFSQQDDNLSLHSDDVPVSQEHHYPTMFVFRLTSSALTNNNCTSVLWTPLSSVSITQRMYSSNKKSANTESAAVATTSMPHMSIQVFDGINKGVPDSTTLHSHKATGKNGSDFSEYKIDKIKLRKWPNRKLRK